MEIGLSKEGSLSLKNLYSNLRIHHRNTQKRIKLFEDIIITAKPKVPYCKRKKVQPSNLDWGMNLFWESLSA